MVEVRKTLGAEGLARFQALQADAVAAVTERFYASEGSAYQRFGPRGRQACREDLAFHLEFLRPVLEFGLLQPMVDYLRWLADVLASRSVPVEHIDLSLDWMGEFFLDRMGAVEGGVVASALRDAAAGFVAAASSPLPAPEAPPSWEESTEFESALLAGRHGEAADVVNRCMDRGHGLVDVEMHVIQPALYRVGEKWQANQVSVAQEHLATAMAKSVMAMGLLRSSPPPLLRRRVLLACVDGNNHTIGLRMVADAFQLAGWQVQFLGASVPTVALIAHTAEWRPHLLGLSVSFAHQLPSVKAIVAGLIERLGDSRPSIMIGGLAINRFQPLAEAVGADLWSTNASRAVVDAGSLAAGRDTP